MVQDDGPVGLDGVRVEFDDERVVSDAGVALVATLAERLGIEALAARWCGCGATGRARRTPGRKVMALLLRDGARRRQHRRHATCCARAARVGCWAAGCRRPRRWGRSCARSRSGTCASSTRCSAESLERAWKAGAGPGDGRLVIDVDSFVGEVCGRLKQGAAYGYTQLLGYHPLLATRADTREALHIRLRKGSANTQKGILRFSDELIARVDPGRRDRRQAAARRLRVLEHEGVRAARAGRLAVLDRRADDQDRPCRRRGDRRGRLAARSTTPTTARRRSPRPSTAAGG